MREKSYPFVVVLGHPRYMSDATCVVCGRGTNVIPLLTLEFQSSKFNICPQHLPVLIHDPAQLIGKLAGAEAFEPAEHKD